MDSDRFKQIVPLQCNQRWSQALQMAQKVHKNLADRHPQVRTVQVACYQSLEWVFTGRLLVAKATAQLEILYRQSAGDRVIQFKHPILVRAHNLLRLQ